MYFLILYPASQPKTGIKAWKKANEKEIFMALKKVIFFITNPLETETAKVSKESPTANKKKVIKSTIYKNINSQKYWIFIQSC